MKDYRKLLLNNKAWASARLEVDEHYFDDLSIYYTLLYTDDTFIKKVKDFCNGYKDIYIIYLCWLIKIYNEPGFIFVESDNEKKYFVYGYRHEYKILVPVYFNIDKIKKKRIIL